MVACETREGAEQQQCEEQKEVGLFIVVSMLCSAAYYIMLFIIEPILMLHHACHDPGQVVLQALVATSGYYSSRRLSMVSNLFPISDL